MVPGLPDGWDRAGIFKLARQCPGPLRAVYYPPHLAPRSIASKLLKTRAGRNVLELSVV